MGTPIVIAKNIKDTSKKLFYFPSLLTVMDLLQARQVQVKQLR